MHMYFPRLIAFVGFVFAISLSIAQSDHQIQRTLEEVAKTMNMEGPQQLGPNLRLDNAIALPGKKFNWRYSFLVGKSQIDWGQIQDDKLRLRNMAITSPDMAEFRQWGVTMKWTYFDIYGEYLFEVVVKPSEYGFVPSKVNASSNNDILELKPSLELDDVFRITNHPKAKGLHFQLNPPKDMVASEALRPNIVHKWQYHGDDLDDYVELQVMVRELPDELKGVSKEEWEYFLKYEDGVEIFLGNDINPRDQKYYVIDRQPGIKVKYHMSAQRLEREFTFHMITAFAVYDDVCFSLNLMTPVEERANNLEMLFDQVCNTVVFPQQY